MNLLKRFLRFLGFEVCVHEWTPWKDEYTTAMSISSYGLFGNTYSERRDSAYIQTHMRQSRVCHNCQNIQVRHIDLKKTGINL